MRLAAHRRTSRGSSAQSRERLTPPSRRRYSNRVIKIQNQYSSRLNHPKGQANRNHLRGETLLLSTLVLALFIGGAFGDDRTGVNGLSASQATRIDTLVGARMPKCESLNIGAAIGGKIVFTKSYGDGRLEGNYEYGSVSKPVTSTILMRLRGEGRIKSLDDNVWAYLPQYANAMPAAYPGSPLTLKHLLTHRSGIPHNDESPFVDGKFNLKFKPGTDRLYSTPGYGILGRVIEAVTGLTFNEAVAKYIGERVGAPSFHAADSFIAPGAFVLSTIRDMARFAVGLMDDRFMPHDVLYDEVLRPETGTYGYGWSVANVDREDLRAFHGGSNGLPRAHLLMKPRRKSAVVILAQLKDYVPFDLDVLAEDILAAIEPVVSAPPPARK
jgi:CubicO group peptidase (beta-lactamase class C family)